MVTVGAQATSTGDRRFDRSKSAALGALVVGGVVVAHLINPYRDHWLPKCPFHELTGLWCPVCGSTRAACALARGDVFSAFRHNVLFLPTLAVVLWVWAAYLVRSFVPSTVGKRWTRSPLTMFRRPWLIVGVFAAFWIVRNIPGLPEHLLSS